MFLLPPRTIQIIDTPQNGGHVLSVVKQKRCNCQVMRVTGPTGAALTFRTPIARHRDSMPGTSLRW
jgi:hypothetical protein